MRTRAYRRHQRARILARHLRVHSALMPLPSRLPKDIASRHPLDCGKQCELCHWAKFNEPRRPRQKRQWQSEAMSEPPQRRWLSFGSSPGMRSDETPAENERRP